MFEPETKELSNYLYDLAHENDIPGGHKLEDGDSEKLRNCAERLDAQTVVINEQAKEIVALRSAISEIRKWDIKTFMSAERYSMLPIELRQLMSNALNAQNSESVGS